MQPFGGSTVGMGAAEDFPQRLLEPSYENRLRVIGRRLDCNLLQCINVLEVDGGFVVRAFREGNPEPLVLEFLDIHFARLIGEALTARGEQSFRRTHSDLVPSGYEDFLRALGHALDGRVAENICVNEFITFFTIAGFAPAGVSLADGYRPFTEALDVLDVCALLEMAHDRRGSYAPITRYVPPGMEEVC